MQIPVQNYTYERFNATLKELSKYYLRSKKEEIGIHLFTVDAEDVNTVICILENAGFKVDLQGEILFLNYENSHYEKKMKSVQYAYFYDSLLLVVFSLKSTDYHNSPLVWAAEKGQELAHLRFFPIAFGDLIERTLTFPDTQVVEFKGTKVPCQSTGEKRPHVQKKITYEVLDGMFALEKIKVTVVPTQATFLIPNKVMFTVHGNGRFILKDGDYEFFRKEIMYPTLESAVQPVKDYKKANLRLVTVDGRTEIERISVTFTISDTYDLNFDDFLVMLEGAGFSPFNEIKKGSVIYKSFLSDEKSGAVLSFYSDGKNFILSPKCGHGLHSLLRFYEFMLQEVDIKTEYTVTKGIMFQTLPERKNLPRF